MQRLRVSVAFATLAAVGCFDATVPDGAQLYCAADSDCPAPRVCNVESHLCTSDARAPTITSITLMDPPADATYADVAGFDVVTVAFNTDEDVRARDCSLTIDALAADACSGDAREHTCALTIPAGSLVTGAQSAQVRARDAAGNVGTAGIDVVIDTEPPAIVADSVEVVFDTAGVITAAPRTDSVVTVTFVASEDLANEPPRAALDLDGARHELDLVAMIGRRLTYRYDDALDFAPGARAVVATLTDRFGHRSDELALTTIEFIARGDTCPHPDIACVDFDADGFVGLAPACPGGADLDDTDPTSFPGALEIPGDGIDNDFVAGDRAIDESIGWFVDCEAGDDVTGDGSRAAPYRSAAPVFLDPDRSVLFLALRATSYGDIVDRFDDDSPITFVVGGLDPVSWTATGERSIVQYLDTNGAWRVDVDELINSEGGVFVDVGVGGALQTVSVPALVVRATIGSLYSDSDVRVLRSTIGDANVTYELVLDRVHVTAPVLLDDSSASLVATNSLFEASADNIGGFTCSTVALFHNTFVSATTPVFMGSYQALRAVGNIFLAGAGSEAIALSAEDAEVILVGNDLFGDDAAALSASGDDLTAEDVNDCTFSQCVRASGNTSSDPGAGFLGALPASSPLRDHGVDAIGEGAPTCVVADAELDCRFVDGRADIGMDEVAP